MSKKVVFIDRDGVINKEVCYLHKIRDFEFINGVFDACLYFQRLGYYLIIVTNQSGISRGYYSEDDFHLVNNWMLEQFSNKGINILDVFFCSHGPESTCDCRKPKPGMFNQANDKHDINMEESWMIGDKETDITAANAAGIQNTILVESGHEIDKNSTNASHVIESIAHANKVINS